jgi:hypothetical protein
MHERPPRRPVAEDPDLAGRERPRDQVVEDDIDTEARRDAVCSRVTHVHGRERVARQFRKTLLGPSLRLRIRAQRAQRRVLVRGNLVLGSAVHAAGRREHEEGDAGLLRSSRQLQGAIEVDGARELGPQVAEWIVRERGQMDDGLKVGEVLGADVADVTAEERRAATVRL